MAILQINACLLNLVKRANSADSVFFLNNYVLYIANKSKCSIVLFDVNNYDSLVSTEKRGKIMSHVGFWLEIVM